MASTDFTQNRNEIGIYDITITLADGTTPVNLTGAALVLQLRRHLWDAAPALTFGIGTGLAIVSLAAGTLTWTVTAAQSGTLAAQGVTQLYYWALGVHTDAPHIPLKGTLTIGPDALDAPA